MPHGIADTRTYQRLYNPLVLRCDRGSVTKAAGVLAGGDEMNDEQRRAYRDAQADYVYFTARKRLIAWRLFWAVILMGMGYRFFMVDYET